MIHWTMIFRNVLLGGGGVVTVRHWQVLIGTVTPRCRCQIPGWNVPNTVARGSRTVPPDLKPPQK